MSEKETLQKELQSLAHDLVYLADTLEGAEGSFRTQIARDYKTTSKAYFKAQEKLRRLNNE
jgi:hypothetical protein